MLGHYTTPPSDPKSTMVREATSRRDIRLDFFQRMEGIFLNHLYLSLDQSE